MKWPELPKETPEQQEQRATALLRMMEKDVAAFYTAADGVKFKRDEQ